MRVVLFRHLGLLGAQDAQLAEVLPLLLLHLGQFCLQLLDDVEDIPRAGGGLYLL